MISYLTEERELSTCRACASVGLSRSAWYRPLLDWRERDREVIEALTGLAEKKPGLGVLEAVRSPAACRASLEPQARVSDLP